MFLVRCDKMSGCGKVYPADMPSCSHCGAAAEFASREPIDPTLYAYDIETYPNTFTCRVIHLDTNNRWRFEISDRIDQRQEFIDFLHALKSCGARMMGYNNEGFDYPVIHDIATSPSITVDAIYRKATSIIKGDDRWGHLIWDDDKIVPQIDLFKIRHYDNVARATSLKALEFQMRMDNIEDLPFDVGMVLDNDQKEVLHTYNDHDTVATCLVYARTTNEIAFREELTDRYGRNFMNFSDTKIGKEYFISELRDRGVECFTWESGRKEPRQTLRTSIDLNQVIFPYVTFERPEFEAVRTHLASKTITETKGVFKGLHADIDGFKHVFGVGGLHASIGAQVVESNDTHQLIDVDVASYYPNLAIKNRLYPAHLGVEFCDIYEDVYNQRRSYAKGTSENAMLKLALNGIYGDSNNVYSPFYDPKYTMTITINGQLLLCMLVEQLIKTPGLSMVQCNTDGVTYLCPREHIEHTRSICQWWEQITQLTLEEALYSKMCIRDVNNYIAVYENGDVKRKGAYEYNLEMHQDPSALIVPKAANAALLDGADIRTFIENHSDNYDFMMRAKVPRSSNLKMRWPEYDVEIDLPKIARYFISKTGGYLFKISPPTGYTGSWKRRSGISDNLYRTVINEIKGMGGELDTLGIPHDERIHTKNKSSHVTREMGISVGWRATECNDVTGFDRTDVDYDYYVAETEKLVTKLLT